MTYVPSHSVDSVEHSWFMIGGVQTAVEDMIWEVDEDCDRGLTWPEFQSMYQRCDNNTSGTLVRRPICTEKQCSSASGLWLSIDSSSPEKLYLSG